MHGQDSHEKKFKSIKIVLYRKITSYMVPVLKKLYSNHMQQICRSFFFSWSNIKIHIIINIDYMHKQTIDQLQGIITKPQNLLTCYSSYQLKSKTIYGSNYSTSGYITKTKGFFYCWRIPGHTLRLSTDKSDSNWLLLPMINYYQTGLSELV